MADIAAENDAVMTIFTSRGMPADAAAVLVAILRGLSDKSGNSLAAGLAHGATASAYHSLDADEKAAVQNFLNAVDPKDSPKLPSR